MMWEALHTAYSTVHTSYMQTYRDVLHRVSLSSAKARIRYIRASTNTMISPYFPTYPPRSKYAVSATVTASTCSRDLLMNGFRWKNGILIRLISDQNVILLFDSNSNLSLWRRRTSRFSRKAPQKLYTTHSLIECLDKASRKRSR